MMLTRDQVNALNPWWTDPDWRSADDLHLAAAEAAPFRWDPRPFDPEDLASGAVFTLRGLRQSGKTTLAKRLIAERVTAGHARRTCFLTLQTIETADELREAIELVLRLWPDGAGDWLFVLDELTFVRDWARPIVYLREHDRTFRAATVLLTGSSAYDLAASADLLHGRRGRWHRPSGPAAHADELPGLRRRPEPGCAARGSASPGGPPLARWPRARRDGEPANGRARPIPRRVRPLRRSAGAGDRHAPRWARRGRHHNRTLARALGRRPPPLAQATSRCASCWRGPWWRSRR